LLRQNLLSGLLKAILFGVRQKSIVQVDLQLMLHPKLL
jgi:hypothetical protein